MKKGKEKKKVKYHMEFMKVLEINVLIFTSLLSLKDNNKNDQTKRLKKLNSRKMLKS